VALTSRFQKFARHLLLAQRKTFLFSCKTSLPSLSLVRKRVSFKRQWHWDQSLLVWYSSIGSTFARFSSASVNPFTGPEGCP
jgi:hypothetical protein